MKKFDKGELKRLKNAVDAAAAGETVAARDFEDLQALIDSHDELLSRYKKCNERRKITGKMLSITQDKIRMLRKGMSTLNNRLGVSTPTATAEEILKVLGGDNIPEAQEAKALDSFTCCREQHKAVV